MSRMFVVHEFNLMSVRRQYNSQFHSCTMDPKKLFQRRIFEKVYDANQSNTQASNNTSIPITVTYRNVQTKTSIARAAQTGKIWNIPTSNVNNRGSTYSFREVSQMRQRTKAEMKSDYDYD